MNSIIGKQYSNQFGSLQVGKILFYKTKDYFKLHTKLANFLEHTWKIKELVEKSDLDEKTKKFVQDSINHKRFWQLQNDVVIEHPEKEDILDRMSYLIQRGRC